MRSFWHLEKGDFFDGIEECKEHFLHSAQRIELKKSDIVFFEGDAGGACFYVASGLLRIFCVTEAGKESTFFLRTAGEIFGLSEVLQDLPRKVSAQALAASVIFRLDRQAFDGLLSRNYALARRVITVMGAIWATASAPRPAMSVTGCAACCSRWHTRACATRPPGNGRWLCRSAFPRARWRPWSVPRSPRSARPCTSCRTRALSTSAAAASPSEGPRPCWRPWKPPGIALESGRAPA